MPMPITRKLAALAVFGVVSCIHSPARARDDAHEIAIVAVPNGGQPLAAGTDSKGTIHLLYNAADGPQHVASTDNGKTFGRPIAVVDRESRKPGLAFTAWDMAVAPDGRVHVAMGTNAWKLKLPKEEWAFFYTSLAPGSSEFSPVQNLNRKPSEGFSLAADGKGNVTACWLSDKLYANVSHDHGKTFAPAVEIDSTFDPCNCCTTSAAYGADGKLAVLYREETNNERDMFLVLWDQDRKTVSRTRVSSTLWKIDGCPMTYYAVAPRGDGFTAVWPTESRIFFARLDSKGALLSPAEIKTPWSAGMRTGILALGASDGSTLIAWKKDGQLNWQLYDSQCRPEGRPNSAKSAGSGVAGVLSKNGDFVLFR